MSLISRIFSFLSSSEDATIIACDTGDARGVHRAISRGQAPDVDIVEDRENRRQYIIRSNSRDERRR